MVVKYKGRKKATFSHLPIAVFGALNVVTIESYPVA